VPQGLGAMAAGSGVVDEAGAKASVGAGAGGASTSSSGLAAAAPPKAGTRWKRGAQATKEGNENDVWSKLAAHNKEQAGKAQRPDCMVGFYGEVSSGKSTLVLRYLNPGSSAALDEAPTKPTTGLEYNFCRRTAVVGGNASSGGSSEKELAHLWEVAGGEALSILADLLITQQSVANAVAVITVDMSDPSGAVDSVTYWINHIRSRVDAVFKEMRQRGSKIPDRLVERAKKVFGAQHEDLELVSHVGIPIVVACTKYDEFFERDSELRRVFSRTMRFICHVNGASLLYTSHRDKHTLSVYRTFMNHLIFRAAPSKLLNTDHAKPLYVPAGSDKLASIGVPKTESGPSMGLQDAFMEWKILFEKYFPATKKDKAKRTAHVDLSSFEENEIDILLKQKESELAAYSRGLLVDSTSALSNLKAAVGAFQGK